MKKKKIIIFVLLGAIIMMAIGYAAFATRLSINGTSNIASNWKVVFTEILQVNKSAGVKEKSTPTASGTTATFDVGLTSPGDVIEYRITVANQGSIDAIIESINASDTGSDAIVFEVTNIKVGDVLLKNATTTFNVKISYKDSIVSQPNILINKLTVNINYAQNIGQNITPSNPSIETQTLAARILNDNNAIQADNVNEISGSGLYYTNKNTEDNKTTYYFRGSVDNNYVAFGNNDPLNPAGKCVYNGQEMVLEPSDEPSVFDSPETCTTNPVCDVGYIFVDSSGGAYCTEHMGGTILEGHATWEPSYDIENFMLWKIVRINENGSVRLILNESIGGINSFGLPSFDDNKYVGYMYGNDNSTTYALTHTNTNDSYMKTNLDNWYTNHLSSYSNSLDENAGFCNDRSIRVTGTIDENEPRYTDTALGYGNNTTYYGNTIGFACPQENDLFTTKDSNVGNKALDYPIGMISKYEANQANSCDDCTNYTLTMTPTSYIDHDENEYGYGAEFYSYRQNNFSQFVLNGSPYLDAVDIVPVINLKSTMEVISGNGTKTNPYIIRVN